MDFFEGNPVQRQAIIGQEITFARLLAGNDKELRDKALKKLRKWLTFRGTGVWGLLDGDFTRISAGLFYCMWMSDKYLAQEELAESISQLVHCFEKNVDNGFAFIKCFFQTLQESWEGLDYHRMDKFQMLTRRFLRQCLVYMERRDWPKRLLTKFGDILFYVVLRKPSTIGLSLHIISIYPEEIAKVSKGKLSSPSLLLLLEPMIKLMAIAPDERVQDELKNFFDHLIKQTDIGLEYEDRLHAWKQQGFPGTGPYCLQKNILLRRNIPEEDVKRWMEDFNGENANALTRALDPRAGGVDVFLPQLPIDVDQIIFLLKKYESDYANPFGKKKLGACIHKFLALKKGKFPEKIVKHPILDEKNKRGSALQNAKRLMEFTSSLNEGPVRTKELKKICEELELEIHEETTDDSEVTEEECSSEEEEEEGDKKTKSRKKTIIRVKDLRNSKEPETEEAQESQQCAEQPQSEPTVTVTNQVKIKTEPFTSDEIPVKQNLKDSKTSKTERAQERQKCAEQPKSKSKVTTENQVKIKTEPSTSGEIQVKKNFKDSKAPKAERPQERQLCAEEPKSKKVTAENQVKIKTEPSTSGEVQVKKNFKNSKAPKAEKPQERQLCAEQPKSKKAAEKQVETNTDVPSTLDVIHIKQEPGVTEPEPSQKKKKLKTKKVKLVKRKTVTTTIKIKKEKGEPAAKKVPPPDESQTETLENHQSPKKKRKMFNTWHVEDLDPCSPEYYLGKPQKTIKLEIKTCEDSNAEENGEPETELKNSVKIKTEKEEFSPAFWNKAKAKVAKNCPPAKEHELIKNPFATTNDTEDDVKSPGQKRISFALDKNTSQENEEYLNEVRNSPQVPFDGSKKPSQGVLKSGLSPSPINPFYRIKKIKRSL